MTNSIVLSNSIKSQSDFIRYIQDNSVGGRNLSIRGLAGLCGVEDTSVIRGSAFNSNKLAEKIASQGFDCAALQVNGFCAQSAWLVIEYFAYESKAKAEGAKRLARLFGSIGLQACFEAAHSPKSSPIELSRLEILQMALESETRAIALAAQIEADAPLVEYAQAVKHSDSSIEFNEFAKIIGTGRTRLFRAMREADVIMKNSTLPYQKWCDAGYFEVSQEITEDGKLIPFALVTGKGQIWLKQ